MTVRPRERPRRALLVAVAAALALALCAATSAAAGATTSLVPRGVDSEDAPVLLEVAMNPTRGDVVMCHRQYDGSPTYKATALNIATWRLGSYSERSEYLLCFSGGRQNHRTDYVPVAPDQLRSLDWGVEITVEKTKMSNLVYATNTRDEDVYVSFHGNSSMTTVEPILPMRRIVKPHSIRRLVNATRFVGAPEASFVFEWRAEPVRFFQSLSRTQLSSKEVTVAVRHTHNMSEFTVFNNRNDPDPVKLMLSVKVMEGTDRRNVVIRNAEGKRVREFVRFDVERGKKAVVMTVAPRSIKRPWYFTWNYKWEIGDSPLQIFGLDE